LRVKTQGFENGGEQGEGKKKKKKRNFCEKNNGDLTGGNLIFARGKVMRPVANCKNVAVIL